MDLTEFMVPPGVIKDTLGKSGLSGVNVSHDANISGRGNRSFPIRRLFIIYIYLSYCHNFNFDMDGR